MSLTPTTISSWWFSWRSLWECGGDGVEGGGEHSGGAIGDGGSDDSGGNYGGS